MNVICFGDSNTYGYDPRSYFGERYAADCRWVDILAERTGWQVRNDGMNGREIPVKGMQFPETTDLLITMLGSNDLLQGASAEKAADRMRVFLLNLNLDMSKVLLIAPPPMQLGEWVQSMEMIDASIRLASSLQRLSDELGVCFANAVNWDVSICFDGVHFTEEGHRNFAIGLLKELGK